jgi:hypothetical protein
MSVSKHLNFNQIIKEKRCKKCKKKFIAAPQHVYKENGSYYCSWTCYNHRHDTEVVKDDQGRTETA